MDKKLSKIAADLKTSIDDQRRALDKSLNILMNDKNYSETDKNFSKDLIGRMDDVISGGDTQMINSLISEVTNKMAK